MDSLREEAMFSISNSQMAQLGQAMDERFVRSAVSRLQISHPVVARSATPAGLESMVRLGLARARGYGLASAVDLYLDLMLSFGSDFDTDPQYLWLRPFLEGMDGVSALEREHLLRWHTRLYLARINGADGGATALTRFSQLDRPILASVGRDFPGTAASLAAQLHPERMDYVDLEALGSLVQRARADAVAFGPEAPVAAALFFALMFRFGHRAMSDPLYPWIGEAQSALREGGIETLLSRAKGFALALAQEIREAKG
jgi:hypothetical protein